MKRLIYCSTNTVEYDSEGNIVPLEIANKFRNSKIRNRQGQLLVCYHGTNAEFEEFKEEFISSSSGNFGWFGKGFYFTNSEKVSKQYGNIRKKCYLNITKPFKFFDKDSVWELIMIGGHPRTYNDRLVPYAYDGNSEVEDFTNVIVSAGYDGVIASYKSGGMKPSDGKEFVCFSPSQIYVIKD